MNDGFNELTPYTAVCAMVERMRLRFGWTRSEAYIVLMAATEKMTREEIATRRGVCLATVKKQVKRLARKCGRSGNGALTYISNDVLRQALSHAIAWKNQTPRPQHADGAP